jgi:hypothetical protein
MILFLFNSLQLVIKFLKIYKNESLIIKWYKESLKKIFTYFTTIENEKLTTFLFSVFLTLSIDFALANLIIKLSTGKEIDSFSTISLSLFCFSIFVLVTKESYNEAKINLLKVIKNTVGLLLLFILAIIYFVYNRIYEKILYFDLNEIKFFGALIFIILILLIIIFGLAFLYLKLRQIITNLICDWIKNFSNHCIVKNKDEPQEVLIIWTELFFYIYQLFIFIIAIISFKLL